MSVFSRYFIGLFILSSFILSGCGKNARSGETGTSEKNAELNMQLGVEYLKRGQYDIALDRLQRAITLDPRYADGHNAIAILYQQLNMPDKAKIHYETALELNPENSDIHNNYGQFLCERGEWQAANTHFMKAIDNPVYRTPHISYTNAAICALRAKNYETAETYLRRVLQNNPNFALALYHMANLQFETSRFTPARDYLKRYLDIAEHTPQTLWLGIRIERALHNRNAVEAYASLLRSRYPDAEQTQLLNQLGL